MSKRKQKDFVDPRQRSRRVRTFIEEHLHLLEEEVSDAVVERNDTVDDRTLRVAEVENVIPVAVSIDDVLGNEDFHETMDDGVENADHHSQLHSSSESDVNYLEEVDSDSETFSDFDFDFCEAPDFHENLVDDADDWDVDSDVDSDLSAVDRQNLFKRRLCNWAVDSNVSRESVNKLLKVLRTDPSNHFLPKTYKTLLGTPRKVDVIAVSPGLYHGFNILDGIVCSLNSINATFSSNSHELNMLVGCDGISVGKSTNSQLWPILGKICMDGAQCFDIGFYHGHAKPDDVNTYLKHFCDEISELMNEGFH